MGLSQFSSPVISRFKPPFENVLFVTVESDDLIRPRLQSVYENSATSCTNGTLSICWTSLRPYITLWLTSAAVNSEEERMSAEE